MGTSRCHRPRFHFSKATSRFWRTPLSKRSLLIGGTCALYLFFALFGYSQQYQDKAPADKAKPRPARGVPTMETEVDPRHGLPTRPNVVYITLRSKRLKPANIRGTIKPKLRRKVRRTQSAQSTFTHKDFGTLGQNKDKILGETLHADYKSLNIVHDSPLDPGSDSLVSSIRMYSHKAPPWFSPGDVEDMRFLADVKVVRIKKVPHGEFSPLLVFESEAGGSHKLLEGSNLCGGKCGVIGSPVDNTEVFAFHLDRVLGLNRTVPAVSRKFSFLYGGLNNTIMTIQCADCCCTVCQL